MSRLSRFSRGVEIGERVDCARFSARIGAMRFADLIRHVDYGLFLPLAARLPVGKAYAAAEFRGDRICKTQHDSRAYALQNVQACFPDLSPQDVYQIVRGHYLTRSRDEMEAFWIKRSMSFLDSLVEIKNLDALQAAADSGKGVLFVSGHLGSLALPVSLIGRKGIPLNCVARSIEPEDNALHPAQYSYARKRVRLIEQAAGRPFILSGKSSYFKVRKLLKSGQVATVLIDVIPVPVRSRVCVPFLGKEAFLGDGIARLYEDTGAHILFWSCVHDSARRKLVVDMRNITGEVDKMEGRASIVQKLAQLLSEKIESHPDHWMLWDSLVHFRPTGGNRTAEAACP
jgi:lauroyl/myristoyl acyltransferase